MEIKAYSRSICSLPEDVFQMRDGLSSELVGFVTHELPGQRTTSGSPKIMDGSDQDDDEDNKKV